MEIITVLLIIFIVLFAMNRFMPVKGVETLTPEETKKKFKEKNVQLIDVRTSHEYETHHLKPFKNIPLANLPDKLHTLDKEKEVVLLCQSGMRSGQAAKLLKKHGFEKVSHVGGGINVF